MKWEITSNRCEYATTLVGKGWEPYAATYDSSISKDIIYFRRQVPEKTEEKQDWNHNAMFGLCVTCGCKLPEGPCWHSDAGNLLCDKCYAERNRMYDKGLHDGRDRDAIRADAFREVGEWMRKHHEYKWCELRTALRSGRMPE